MSKFFNKYLPYTLAAILLVTAGFFWVRVQTARASVALVINTRALATGGTGATITTPAGVDTTGATLLVAVVTDYLSGPSTTVSDSNGNTWHALTRIQSGSGFRNQIFYAYDHGGTALVVGANHTFSASSGDYNVLDVLAFSGTQTSSDPFDVQNGSFGTTQPTSPGSITPSADGEVIIAGIGYDTTNTLSIDSSFNITNQDPFSSSVHFGGDGSYFVQSTAAAINPSWSAASNFNSVKTIASFKAAAGGATTPCTGPTASTVAICNGSVTVQGILAIGPAAPVSAGCGNGFSYCRTITIDHTKVPNTDQASFPILICANGSSPCNATVTGLNQTGGGAHVQNSNGYDINFFTSSGCTTKVTGWEMEKYVASTGEMIAWVNDGTLSHTVDTTLYMCYGNSGISTFQSTASATWDANYKGVWHVPDGTSLSLADSTGNATPTNNGATATSGNIDGAALFTRASSQYASFTGLASTGTQTFETWVKFTTIPGFEIVANFSNAGSTTDGLWVGAEAGKILAGTRGSATGSLQASGISTATWYYVVIQKTTGAVNTIWVNGVSSTTANSTDWGFANETNYQFGADVHGGSPLYFLDGVIDEARLSNTTRSADWIATSYNNQSAPSTFETFGAE